MMNALSFWQSVFHPTDEALRHKTMLLQKLPAFESVELGDLQPLAQKCLLRQLGAEVTVYPQGSPAVALYFVAQGSVGLFQRRRSGQTDRIRVVAPGQFFGDAALFSPNERQHSAKTLENSLLLALFKSDYEELAITHPRTALIILTLAAAKLHHDLTVFQTEFHELSQKIAKDQLRA